VSTYYKIKLQKKTRLSPKPHLDKSLLEVDSLRVNYSTERTIVKAVDEVTFGVPSGEAFGLAGESGSGKSTIAQTVLKLLPTNAKIEAGRIIFDGAEILKMNDEEFRTKYRWKRISTVPQAAMNALTPVHRINRQIAEAITTHEHVNAAEALSRASELLEMVGIRKERGSDYPHQFSGGMKQRAVIAMALACNPSLLIADEPTTGLDVVTQAEILQLLEDLKSRLGLSIIFITHDLSILPNLCDKVGIMYMGKMVEQGDSNSLFINPTHPYTRALLASFPDIENSKERLRTMPDPIPPVREAQTGCRFSPRCEFRFDQCQKEPQPREIAEDHFVLCHLA
jgi:peptide/nickel transport system ATP-binding protein